MSTTTTFCVTSKYNRSKEEDDYYIVIIYQSKVGPALENIVLKFNLENIIIDEENTSIHKIKRNGDVGKFLLKLTKKELNDFAELLEGFSLNYRFKYT